MTVYLNDLGIVCSLGNSPSQVANALFNDSEREYLLPHEGLDCASDTLFYTGQVALDEHCSEAEKSVLVGKFNTRNNRLVFNAYRSIAQNVQAFVEKYGADRVAVVMGTSTSGVKEGEYTFDALHELGSPLPSYHYNMQEMNAPAKFIAHLSGATGPCFSISTACSSSAKALVSARALIESDLVDVVICGGADTLSRLPNSGFHALESTASGLCNPFSSQRDGINIGEGAALFVMSKEQSAICLAGAAETSDAYHISSPDPDGKGAISAMQQALQDADIQASDIDYINLHGTGTMKNDVMEAKAVFDLFSDKVLCSSTKRFTGHTLGAAGAVEAAILWLTLSDFNIDSKLPPHKSDFQLDPELAPISLCDKHSTTSARHVMSNSFAFGGNNASIILSRAT